jgi:hypothetical protein
LRFDISQFARFTYWLKYESLDASDNLPDPDVIAKLTNSSEFRVKSSEYGQKNLIGSVLCERSFSAPACAGTYPVH